MAMLFDTLDVRGFSNIRTTLARTSDPGPRATPPPRMPPSLPRAPALTPRPSQPHARLG